MNNIAVKCVREHLAQAGHMWQGHIPWAEVYDSEPRFLVQPPRARCFVWLILWQRRVYDLIPMLRMEDFSKAIMNTIKSVMKSLQLKFFSCNAIFTSFEVQIPCYFLFSFVLLFITYKLRNVLGFETSETGLWGHMKESWIETTMF